MPEIISFGLNGVTTTFTPAPEAIGPLSDDVIAVVGTAPDADTTAFPLNTPVRINSYEEAAKLDTTGNGLGFLVHFCEKTLQQARVPIYVIRVDVGATDPDTIANVIGGVDAGTGQKTGISTILDCLEKPTLIASPGWSSNVGVAQALGAIRLKIGCRFVVDLEGLKATDVITLADTFGNADTGFDGCIAVAHDAIYTNKYGELTMPGSVVATGAIASHKPWVGPGHTGVPISGVDVIFNYNVTDPSTTGNLLNKNGICYFGVTSSGGWSLIGNRTLTGTFVSNVGLVDSLTRKLVKVIEKNLGGMLTLTAMEQEVTKVNNWLENLIAEDVTMPGTRCYLHPTKNTLDNYKSGRWFIVVEFAGYSVNENPVIELVESDGIVETFIGGL